MHLKSQVIVGIDPGTVVTGYAVITKDKRRPLQASVAELGTFRKRGKLTAPQRISAMHRVVEELVRRYQPSAAVVERAFFDINAASALRLGEARGAIFCACHNISPDIELVEIAPAQVKQYIAGRGNASKQEVATALARMLKLNLDRAPHDVTDALALAFCHHLASLPLRPVQGGYAASNSPRSRTKHANKGRAQLSCVPSVDV